MLFVSGISYKYILMLMGVAVASFPVMWFFVLNDKRKDRIRVFFNLNWILWERDGTLSGQKLP